MYVVVLFTIVALDKIFFITPFNKNVFEIIIAL